MNKNKINSIKRSNNYINNLLDSNNPFIISRVRTESKALINKILKKPINKHLLNILDNNAGIYSKNNNKLYNDDINKFINISIKCYINSNTLLCFDKLHVNMQNFFLKNFKLNRIDWHVSEPFRLFQINGIKPWTHNLLGKKVLIVSPFISSMKKQIDNKFKMFKDKDIFLEGQEFIFYKCFQTSAGNHLHKSWAETFQIMCDDIEKLDFDIALLSCGGYGEPLSYFIHNNLKKSAIYVGANLQLYFGIGGKRWYKPHLIPRIEKENGCKFIRPSGDELTKNRNKVEGGCYW